MIDFGSNKFEKFVSVDAVQGTKVEPGLGLGASGSASGNGAVAGMSGSPSGSSTAAQTPKTPRLKNSNASASTSGSTGGQTPVMNGVTVKTEQGQGQGQEEKWEESSRVVYERVSLPSEPVNAFGIPQATMRCLEVGFCIKDFLCDVGTDVSWLVTACGERRTDV